MIIRNTYNIVRTLMILEQMAHLMKRNYMMMVKYLQPDGKIHCIVMVICQNSKRHKNNGLEECNLI